jgi:uncharacterized protein YjbI with pentapeptide repeats
VAEWRRYSKVGARAVANEEHLDILRQGVEEWNEWRIANPDIVPDLREADFEGARLSGVKLFCAELSGANLNGAVLFGADLTYSKIRRANLSEAVLSEADLTSADLSAANLSNTDLTRARCERTDLTGADLRGANLRLAYIARADLHAAHLNGADFSMTTLSFLNLTETVGLEECEHAGPSAVDWYTLLISRNLPISFLRGCGVPEIVIEYLPSLRGDAIQHYSCFISYSSKDQTFAERLHADLQNKGVRCWFAPHDLPIGAKTWDAIDNAIRLIDKLLVILSEASIASDWVEDEVNKAYAEERDRNETVLFPIRIDDTVMTTPEPWARKLRDQRNIGDFRQWKKPAEYQRSLERLLRDLKASGAG